LNCFANGTLPASPSSREKASYKHWLAWQDNEGNWQDWIPACELVAIRSRFTVSISAFRSSQTA
jgi:hypothetical protein